MVPMIPSVAARNNSQRLFATILLNMRAWQETSRSRRSKGVGKTRYFDAAGFPRRTLGLVVAHDLVGNGPGPEVNITCVSCLDAGGRARAARLEWPFGHVPRTIRKSLAHSGPASSACPKISRAVLEAACVRALVAAFAKSSDEFPRTTG